jgi:hypothetical protein
MTLAHFIYIPAILLVGIVIGYILGGRAAEGAKVEKADAERRRDARRARRERRESDAP